MSYQDYESFFFPKAQDNVARLEIEKSRLESDLKRLESEIRDSRQELQISKDEKRKLSKEVLQKSNRLVSLENQVRCWARPSCQPIVAKPWAMFLSSTSLLLTSTRWLRSTIKLLHCLLSLSSAITIKLGRINFFEKNWECRESNLGRLGGKRERYR